MKRLLLPLLAVLALPTAVNANPFSGDIVIKNAIGEKTIVKKATIRLEKNTVNGSYERLQKRITMFDRVIKKSQEKLKEAQKFATEQDLTILSGEADIDNEIPNTINIEAIRVESANEIRNIDIQLSQLKELNDVAAR